jgi:hypothetical protein
VYWLRRIVVFLSPFRQNIGQYCHVFAVCVTNNNGFCTWWLGLLAFLYNYCTTNYNSSHTQLVLNSELRFLSNECCMKDLWLNFHEESLWRTSRDRNLQKFPRYSVLSVSAETNEPLPSKLTSASPAIQNFLQCLPGRCLEMDYSVTVYFVRTRPLLTIIIAFFIHRSESLTE